MKGMFRRAWEKVRLFPFAKFFKPLWKGALKLVIQKYGDSLQEEVKRVAKVKGPAEVDSLIDRAQARLAGAISTLPLPDGIEQKVLKFVKDEGDILQSKIRWAVEQKSDLALDRAFDSMQAFLKAKVDQL